MKSLLVIVGDVAGLDASMTTAQVDGEEQKIPLLSTP